METLQNSSINRVKCPERDNIKDQLRLNNGMKTSKS
jgi:hypothetical protein